MDRFFVNCLAIVVAVAWLTVVVSGNAIRLNDDDISLTAVDNYWNSRMNRHEPTVHHFARHSVCKSVEGMRKFYYAMSDHLCEISDELKFHIVMDLCKRKGEMLDKWVAEIYDIDRDGYIAHFEKIYHDD